MRFKTLPIFTLATYRMGSKFSIRVTPNINLITVGLMLDETVQRVDYSRKSKGNADVVSGGESQETIDQRMNKNN